MNDPDSPRKLKFIKASELAAMDFSDASEPRIDDERIAIDFPSSPGGSYFVELNRCDTHAKIVHWVAHLGEKGWATAAHLRVFVILACEANNLKLWGSF